MSSSNNSIIDTLPFDVLLSVFSHLRKDAVSLWDCLTVCKVFKDAVLPSLYETIVLKYLKDYPEGSNFNALHTLGKPEYEYLHAYVRFVDFQFVLNDHLRRLLRAPPQSSQIPFSPSSSSSWTANWTSSLSYLPNIQSYTFRHPDPPHRFLPFPSEILDGTISALKGKGNRHGYNNKSDRSNSNSKLEELNLLFRVSKNDVLRLRRGLGGSDQGEDAQAQASDTEHAVSEGSPSQSHSHGRLRSIALGLPARDIFSVLGPWLSEGFRRLSILDAYAIDSPTLFQPYISSLHTLHLGPHHTLRNVDLLNLFTHTPQLRHLDVFYDGFLNLETLYGHDTSHLPSPSLSHLSILTIQHQGVSSKTQFSELFTFLSILMSSSQSSLTALSLISDDERECAASSSAGLEDILLRVPGTPNLDFLNIPHIVLRPSMLRAIFSNLKKLKVVSLFLVDIKLLDFYLDNPAHRSSPSTSSSEISLRNLTALYLRSNRATCPYASVPGKVQRMMEVLRVSPVDDALTSRAGVDDVDKGKGKAKGNRSVDKSSVDKGSLSPGYLRKVVSQRPEERRQQTWNWRALWTAVPHMYSGREGMDALKDEGLGF
ncbi:hypothetical protein D9758_011350 [Tetrapyrgos nigripes]|uniref:F-box domain-containing protein n=1 Tax=Tetrapyrgos nigripes TaxID=182062 RepID=A0A8H5LK11_9AGAR|nr:hypothetical protein D9758_011350 [Tetrapyrgos nigripes]